MSDLAATNCGCSTDNGCGCNSIIWIILLLSCCGNGSFCGNNNGCGCSGGGNDCCWLILLLLFCAAVATTAAAMAVDAVTMTTAGSSWFCFFFAATTALAAVTAAEDVDADPAPFNKLQSADKKQRIISSAFVCFFLPVALFLSAYFPFYA